MKPSELPLLVKIILLAAPIPIGLLLAFSEFTISNELIQGVFILGNFLFMLKLVFGRNEK